ncbi:MAG: DsbC family protein [Gammaproteobacteria bacterium]|nr:DsbC family protein [Gammaproteobacteria bacterium]MDH3552290.1 DsbC family protein [Gammaproteobacteria bacterium]
MSHLTSSICIRVTAIAAAIFAFAPAHAAEDSNELDQVRQKVGSMFDAIEPDDVDVSPVDGWYTIQRGSIVAYISGDGRYLLQGDMIDLDNQVNLSELARIDSRRKLIASVTDDQVIRFSPADVKYSVSVFTDVDCTYCRRLHSQIEEYMAQGIEVRYLLYPRNGPASPSWNTAEEVWCSPDRGNALTMAKLDRKFETTTCDASMVQNHYVIGRDVGLSGTPAIVLADGTLISGYMPPDQLALRLEQNAAQH